MNFTKNPWSIWLWGKRYLLMPRMIIAAKSVSCRKGVIWWPRLSVYVPLPMSAVLEPVRIRSELPSAMASRLELAPRLCGYAEYSTKFQRKERIEWQRTQSKPASVWLALLLRCSATIALAIAQRVLQRVRWHRPPSPRKSEYCSISWAGEISCSVFILRFRNIL